MGAQRLASMTPQEGLSSFATAPFKNKMAEVTSSKRTKAPSIDEDDIEDGLEVTSSDLAEGRFRSRVFDANTQSQFPTAPLYQLNERVYLIVPGRTQPDGPYLIKEILGNRQYKLKREDSGQELRDPVREDDLVEWVRN